MSEVATAGDKLTISQIEEMFEDIKSRRMNFPEEPGVMSLGVVLMNFGDRYATVECVAGEWSGLKKELQRTGDIPKCPNGHVLTQGPGLHLTWAADLF